MDDPEVQAGLDDNDLRMLQQTGEHVLVVDDEHLLLEVTSASLTMVGLEVSKAQNVSEALELLEKEKFDLVLSDIRMPRETGVDLMRYCIERKYGVPFILMSGFADSDLIIEALNLGASYFLTKPFPLDTLVKQVEAVLSQKRYANLHAKMLKHLKQSKQILEQKVHERTEQLERAQDAIGMVLSGMAETRDPETGEHLARTRGYALCLANALLENNLYVDELEGEKLGMICRATILHDVGKVGVADYILLKPGKLTPEEFEEMKKHTLYGCYVFDRAIEFCGEDPFLITARYIARSHHEWWDGLGYPDGLSGKDIPLGARIMSVADVYDALISKRCYKEAFSREVAEEAILKGAGTQFDPDLVEIFMAKRGRFAEIALEHADVPAGV